MTAMSLARVIQLAIVAWSVTAADLFHFTVKVENEQIGYVNHFWRSTGFCPPDPHQSFHNYLFSDDEYQNLAHIASTPNSGIKQVRIHWLLDLVTASVSEGAIVYNFTYLDQAIERLHSLGLKPGFEIMGNPSNIFNDFSNKTQVYAWRDLVYETVDRYIHMYGLDYVSSWNFESWNEPDNGDFDKLPFTPNTYLNYYDACVEGLGMVKYASLKMGAPGEKCTIVDSYCMKLLLHCYNGTNYFTGKTGTRLDYLSFHIKGDSSAMSIVESEIAQVSLIQKLFPSFQYLPVYNDEADPLTGWNKPEDWRADARYAGLMAKGVALHQNLLFPTEPNINYQLLSNDNGFMNFPPYIFEQRTLTARFQMNLTKPRSVEFIRKPGLSVMGLMSLLGAYQLNATVTQDGNFKGVTDQVGVVATYLPSRLSLNTTNEAAFLIYNSLDSSSKIDDNYTVNLTWSKLDLGKNPLLVQYTISNIFEANPYAIWKSAGSPVYPSMKLLQEMRSASNRLLMMQPVNFTAREYYSFNLPLPSVAVIHACEDPTKAPAKVQGVKLYQITAGETMITWTDNVERCLMTYEIAFTSNPDDPYVIVHTENILFTLYVFWNPEYKPGMKQYFKVRAVDYWKRPGVYSDSVYY